MAHTKAANYLKTTKLQPAELEAIEGCLIGDGTLVASGKHYRLRVRHTVRHSEYTDWKYQLLQRVCITGPKYDKYNDSVRVGTVGHPELSKMRDQWYDKAGTKFVPQSLQLTPLMIAIWFMDDGTKQGASIDFSVHCFSLEDINLLRMKLAEFNIDTTVNSDGKGYRLYVRRKSYDSFKELVTPYIQTCMTYKLP